MCFFQKKRKKEDMMCLNHIQSDIISSQCLFIKVKMEISSKKLCIVEQIE